MREGSGDRDCLSDSVLRFFLTKPPDNRKIFGMTKRFILTFLMFFLLPSFRASGSDELIVTHSSNPIAREAVDRSLTLFTVDIKERFSLYLSRSGRYIEMMRGILREKGIPEEIAFLALIESGFNTHAYSRSKAVGPWQFIASTAKRYGLKMDWWVDERRDPVKSTVAAAAYLNDLYGMFGSWSLAMAAYNAGEGKIMRAVARINSNDFWEIQRTKYIKAETKNYVPKFIAAKMIASDPEGFGFSDLEYEQTLRFDEVGLDDPIDLDIAAECAGTTVEEIKRLNPELNRWCTPPNVDLYTLRIPEGRAAEFTERLASKPLEERLTINAYTVRKGDTLYKISGRLGVSLESLLALNSLTKKSILRIGQVLYVPTKGGARLGKDRMTKLREKLGDINPAT